MNTKHECFYLYAKGHYPQSHDILGDLRVIISNLCAILPEHVSEEDIALSLIDAVMDYIFSLPIGQSAHQVRSILEKICHAPINTNKRTASESLIYECLSLLALRPVFDGDLAIFEIGEAKPEITSLLSCRQHDISRVQKSVA